MSALIRALLFLPLLLFTPLHSRGGIMEQTVTEELSGDLSPEASIVVENVNGQILLIPGTDDRYRIEITKKSRTAENLELMEVRHDIDYDRLELKVHLPKKKGWFSFSQIQGSVELVITVPASVSLDDIRTVNGSVELSGFTNQINASSVNGRINAKNLSGSAQLGTVNGTINTVFADLSDDDKVSIESVNGGITLRFPESLNADLRTSVVNGRVQCDFPITLDDDASPRKLRGRIGEGGAEIKVSTVNGSISVRQI